MGCSASSNRQVMDSHIRKQEDGTTSKAKKSSTAKVSSFYDIGAQIGAGGFGKVNEAVEKKTGEIYAIKILSKLKFKGEEERENMKYETELMSRVVGHPNVVHLYETYEDKWNFYLVMEHCSGGEMMDRILKDRKFSEKTASRYFKMMVSAIKHCHDRHVVHRDLKPENFLFANHSETAAVKLTDFGLSTYIEKDDSVITEACGSAYYIAPEVFSRHYTKSADVWSLGVILFLLLSGTVPFGADAQEETQVYTAIQTQPLKLGRGWSSVSASARELVMGLLEKDPHKRYTVEQALSHPWVMGEGVSDAPIDREVVEAMAHFNAKNKFKKQALKLIASTLSAEDVRKLREAFAKIDDDHTGTISLAELAAAVQDMGYDKANVQQLMAQMDQDGDGQINYEEFITATADRQLVHHQNNIWWAFCEYDRDGDGYVTMDELSKIMGDDSEQLKKYISEYDRDNDGRINYEEFMRMVLPSNLKIRIQKY